MSRWQIFEGQFVDNRLRGFGRIVSGDGIYAIGYWQDDTYFQGYCKRIKDGLVTEGQFDGVNYLWGQPSPKFKIKMYNPNVDMIAKKIDYDKYKKAAQFSGEAYQKMNAMQAFKDDLQT